MAIGNRLRFAVSTALLAIAFLWSTDFVSRAVLLLIWPDEMSLPMWPLIGRIITQSVVFACLMTFFAASRPKLGSFAGFGALLGIFAWLPSSLYLFERIPRFDWDVAISALAIGSTLAVAAQWALLGYLSGRLARMVR